ncbi:MAG: APC family permease [Actinomycetia bacterium]|nr:APC family permease [Actinomycetes bacterium]
MAKQEGAAPELSRVLGVSGLWAVGYGNVGSSIYYALGVTTLYALGASPIVLMVAGVFFTFTALSYAEGTAMLPEAGGSSNFARLALNEVFSFFAGWALMLDYIVTIAISAFTSVSYLSYFIPGMDRAPDNVIGGLVVVALLMALNIVGVRETSWVNVFFALLDIATEVFLIIVGVAVVLNGPQLVRQIHWGTAPTWHALIYSVSIAMVAYTGIESVANLAEEARQPSRTVPRAMMLVVGAVLAIYLGISSVALSALPVHYDPRLHAYTSSLGTRWINDPVAGIVRHLGVFSHILAPWVALLGFTILLVATNAGLLGVSRLTYSMGRHRQIPEGLHRLHPRFHTPYVAICFFSLLAMVLILPGSVEDLADLYSYGALLAFTTAHAAIIILRVKRPDLPRPFMPPGNVRVGKALIPLTAVLGGLGTFGTWLAVALLHPVARVVGPLWIVFGMTLYVVYRRRHGLSLTRTWQPARGESP